MILASFGIKYFMNTNKIEMVYYKSIPGRNQDILVQVRTSYTGGEPQVEIQGAVKWGINR